jgi:hypothetical protein
MRTVHWVGVGLSNGRTGLGILADRPERLVLWGRDPGRVARRAEALGLTGRAETALFDGSRDALRAAVGPGDVVVSMLPGAEHAGLLTLAREAGAHFACTSYVSPAVAAAAEGAERDGTVVLTEAGLDPGIDHLMAHDLVRRAREAVGDQARGVRFTSYCGGLPAVPNDFRYRFSWAPYGVLAALGSPAAYIAGGEGRVAERPWEATSEHRIGQETFEVYPNRDSLPFVAQYGVPQGWELDTFVRGTLRNEGWRAAWGEVFATVRAGDEARLRALAEDLAERYPTSEEDRDRVVLEVSLEVEGWRGRYLLDLVGEAGESAMARCVTLPLAYAVGRVLDGAVAPGLRRAGEEPPEVGPWLEHLGEHGVRCLLDIEA